MATYDVNPAGVRRAAGADRGEAVRPRQRLGRRAAERRGAERLPRVRTTGRTTPAWHLGLTEGASDHTKARYAFVYGDFRRVHRSGLIACVYRAAEWRHKQVELAAHDLLQRLDRSPGSAERPVVAVHDGDPDAVVGVPRLPAALLRDEVRRRPASRPARRPRRPSRTP